MRKTESKLWRILKPMYENRIWGFLVKNKNITYLMLISDLYFNNSNGLKKVFIKISLETDIAGFSIVPFKSKTHDTRTSSKTKSKKHQQALTRSRINHYSHFEYLNWRYSESCKLQRRTHKTESSGETESAVATPKA